LAARAFPFELFSRQEVALDDASELLTSMAGKGSEPPPVHGVIVPGL